MSFNANTIYKAVNIDQVANECKDAISQDSVYVIIDMFGYVHSIYKSLDAANAKAAEYNKGDPDGYWTVETHGLR